jgi:hypothetical protein
VPRLPFPRRVGPLGLALTLYDVYRRLPPQQRRQLLDLGRKHGPRIAARAVQAGVDARRRRPRR